MCGFPSQAGSLFLGTFDFESAPFEWGAAEEQRTKLHLKVNDRQHSRGVGLAGWDKEAKQGGAQYVIALGTRMLRQAERRGAEVNSCVH